MSMSFPTSLKSLRYVLRCVSRVTRCFHIRPPSLRDTIDPRCLLLFETLRSETLKIPDAEGNFTLPVGTYRRRSAVNRKSSDECSNGRVLPHSSKILQQIGLFWSVFVLLKLQFFIFN